MLMEHSFHEATIGEKWNVCEMDYLLIKILYLSNTLIQKK